MHFYDMEGSDFSVYNATKVTDEVMASGGYLDKDMLSKL